MKSGNLGSICEIAGTMYSKGLGPQTIGESHSLFVFPTKKEKKKDIFPEK